MQDELDKSNKAEEPASEQKKPSRVWLSHDRYVGSILSNDRILAADFLKAYLPERVTAKLDWSRIEVEPTVHIDGTLKRHLLDLSFSVPLLHSKESERFIIVVEHKSNKPKNAALQLFKYCVIKSADSYTNNRKLADGRAPWPVPVLFHNGAKPWKNLPKLIDAVGFPRGCEELELELIPSFKYYTIDLATFDIKDLHGDPLVRVFLEMLKRGKNRTMVSAIKELQLPWNVGNIDWDSYPEERLTPFLRKTTSYITYTTINSGEQISMAEIQRMVDEIENRRVNKKMKTFVDEFMEEGYAKGRIEEAIGSIQKYLKIRFGSAPEDMLQTVNAVGDYPTVEKSSLPPGSQHRWRSLSKASITLRY